MIVAGRTLTATLLARKKAARPHQDGIRSGLVERGTTVLWRLRVQRQGRDVQVWRPLRQGAKVVEGHRQGQLCQHGGVGEVETQGRGWADGRARDSSPKAEGAGGKEQASIIPGRRAAWNKVPTETTAGSPK